jgi:hypothetical protein
MKQKVEESKFYLISVLVPQLFASSVTKPCGKSAFRLVATPTEIANVNLSIADERTHLTDS